MRWFFLVLFTLLMVGCPGKKSTPPPENPPAAPAVTPEATPEASPATAPSPTGTPETPSPTPELAATPTPAPTSQETSSSPLEGAWITKDADGESFDLILQPQGIALTNWTKGPGGMSGQRGQWQRSGDGFVAVKYDDGSADAILWMNGKWRLKRHPRAGASFDPLAAPAQMERVEPRKAKFVGSWKMNQEPDGSYLMITLYSDGRAVSTVNGKTAGQWEPKGKGALCSWPDNWYDMLEPKEDGWQRRSWVGSETNGEADSSEAVKIGGSPK